MTDGSNKKHNMKPGMINFNAQGYELRGSILSLKGHFVRMKKLFVFLFIPSFFYILPNVNAADGNERGWKAGVARIAITPEQPLWMAGYDNRDHPSEGKIHELWAKALALEDANGKQCILITADLGSIPRDMSIRIRNRLEAAYRLSRSQIIINCSHTHSGPVIQDSLSDLYSLDIVQLNRIKEYSEKLEGQIVALAGSAIGSLKPAEVYAENGIARFQVNRRNNSEASLLLQTELRGPNDYAVPVIKVTDNTGSVIAIAFGYACHNNVLNNYQWSGDYAGFAQLELEKLYPGATALFFQGAGGDQDPLPRHSVPLAKQYGEELTYAVEKVLSERMRRLSPQLSFSYSEVELPLNNPPAKEELVKMSQDNSVTGYKRRSVFRLLERLERGEALRKSYPYPVQVWKLGDQTIFAMGGEVVIHYAIEIKKMFGNNTFVLGYSNDVMSYIPSLTILRESNDDGSRSSFYNPISLEAITNEGSLLTQLAHGLPGTWTSNIEAVIFEVILRTAREAGVALFEYK